MKYLKVFTDFVKDMELLNDSERGRLFTAMLLYAEDGTEVDLKGNERFIWATAKKNIDSQQKNYDAKSENMARARANNINNNKALLNNKEQVIVEEQEQDKEQEQEQEKNKKPKRDKSLLGGVGDVFQSFAGNDPELLEALTAFDAMRKRLSKPMTDRARELLIKELQKYPAPDWIPMLEQSTLKGWQSVYPLKDSRNGSSRTAQMLDDSYEMMNNWAKERQA